MMCIWSSRAPGVTPAISSALAYLIFGQAAFESPRVRLESLDSQFGFRIEGAQFGDNFGAEVSGLGDVNADGLDDFAIFNLENRLNRPFEGPPRLYIVFGRVEWLSDAPPSSCGKPDYDRTEDPGLFLWQDCPDGTPNGQWHLLASAGGNTKPVRYDGVIQAPSAEPRRVRYEPSDRLLTTADSFAFVMRVVNSGVDGIDFSTPVDGVAPLCADITLNFVDAPLFLGVGRKRLATDAPIDLNTGQSCALAPPLDTCGRPRFDGTSGLYLWQICGTGEWRMAAVAGRDAQRFDGTLYVDSRLSNVRPIRFESDDKLRVLSTGTVTFDMRAANYGSDVVAFNLDQSKTRELCLDLSHASGNTSVWVGRQNTLKTLQSDPINLFSDETCGPGSLISGAH